MLSLLQDERALLLDLGLLAKNTEGEETLAGLTSAESNFLVNFKTDGYTAGDLAERYLYDQILRAHLRARLEAFMDWTVTSPRPGRIGLRPGNYVRLRSGGPSREVMGVADSYVQALPVYSVELARLAHRSQSGMQADGGSSYAGYAKKIGTRQRRCTGRLVRNSYSVFRMNEALERMATSTSQSEMHRAARWARAWAQAAKTTHV